MLANWGAKSRLLFILLAVWWAGPAAATAVPTTGDELVIDTVEVEGQTGSSVSMVRTIIDVPVGLPLSRADLDQRLAEIRLRLLALGYYRDPWLRLERGATRGHYRLIVQGETYGSSYYGAGLSRQSSGVTVMRALQREAAIPFYDGTAFIGERNWRGQGIWLDGQLDELLGHSNFNSPSANGTINLNATNLTLTSFAPSLGNGRYLAGLRLQSLYEDLDSNYNFDVAGPKGNERFSFASHQRIFRGTAVAQAGVRFGLASVAAVWLGDGFRGISGSPNMASQSHATYGIKTTYSEKSYLALVEPGLDLQVDALRKVSNLAAPAVNLSALYTWMPGEGFGVTPGIRRTDDWTPRYYGSETEAYLHLDWVTSARWAISAEPRWDDRNSAFEHGAWTNGLTLTARFIGRDSLYSLSLIIGEQGLAQSLTPGLRELVR